MKTLFFICLFLVYHNTTSVFKLFTVSSSCNWFSINKYLFKKIIMLNNLMAQCLG